MQLGGAFIGRSYIVFSFALCLKIHALAIFFRINTENSIYRDGNVVDNAPEAREERNRLIGNLKISDGLKSYA
jgi:hypothetical protein